jgi:copper homeostasis protein
VITCEVCVEGVDGALAAAAGGAHRIEICAGLVEGGTTPSFAILSVSLERAGVDTMVLVRPRGGDFLYSEAELEVMLRDVRAVREAGAMGVATGVLTREGCVDREATARLREAAGPLSFTFHRAFDMTRDPLEALETLVELGADRILTSGQAESVPQGIALIRELVERAGERIVIMPGAGIREENVGWVLAETRAREIHFTALSWAESPMLHRNPVPRMGGTEIPGEYRRQGTDPERVRGLLAMASGAAGG